MKTCNNCLWYDTCDHTERCEFYDPIDGAENIALREYKAYLKEQADDDQETIDEQNS